MRRMLDMLFATKKSSFYYPIGTAVIVYLAFAFLGTAENKTALLLIIPIVAVVCFFAVFFIFYLQIKNPLCPEGFLDVIELVAAFIFAIYGTIGCVSSAAGGFENLHIGTCVAYVAYSAISLAHRKRMK